MRAKRGKLLTQIAPQIFTQRKPSFKIQNLSAKSYIALFFIVGRMNSNKKVTSYRYWGEKIGTIFPIKLETTMVQSFRERCKFSCAICMPKYYVKFGKQAIFSFSSFSSNTHLCWYLYLVLHDTNLIFC